MRFQELGLTTFREPASSSQTRGEALLYRAGVQTRAGDATAFGRLILNLLGALSDRMEPPELFSTLGVSCLTESVSEKTRHFFPISSGPEHLLHCPGCHYAARPEFARFETRSAASTAPLPMHKIPTPECNTIAALTTFLGIAPAQTAKALLRVRPQSDQIVFVVVRGDRQLSLGKLTLLVGETTPATATQVLRSGAAPGYASPVGLSNAFTVVDRMVAESSNLVAGANDSGFHLINVNYGRDFDADVVADIVVGLEGDLCAICGVQLEGMVALEIGNATSIQPQNVLAAVAETHRDERGLRLPRLLSPFQAHLLNLPSQDPSILGMAQQLYLDLMRSGLAVLFDDRPQSAGVKLTDADLIGLPVRLVVSERNARNGMVELKFRTSGATMTAPVGDVITALRSPGSS